MKMHLLVAGYYYVSMVLMKMDIQDPAHARRTLRKLAAELADLGGRNHKNVVVISARRESWPTVDLRYPQFSRI